MAKARIGVRLDERLYQEVKTLSERYGVSEPYILMLGFKLTDREILEQMLKLRSE